MTDQPRTVRIAAVADLHGHKGQAGEYRQLLADMAAESDVILLAGDITNLGLPEEAENLAADFTSVRVPILAVLGNHDHHSGQQADVKRILGTAGVKFLDDEAFELHGVGFAGVKGFGGGFSQYMLSAFGEDTTKHFVTEAVNEALALENSLKGLATSKIVVAMHYSPVAETVQGESPEIFPFMGCSRLAETIDRFEVAAVFHGHAHHGAARGRTPRGIPVYNCCLEVMRRAGGKPFVTLEV
jgi:uncharacterized protein